MLRVFRRIIWLSALAHKKVKGGKMKKDNYEVLSAPVNVTLSAKRIFNQKMLVSDIKHRAYQNGTGIACFVNGEQAIRYMNRWQEKLKLTSGKQKALDGQVLYILHHTYQNGEKKSEVFRAPRIELPFITPTI